MSMNKNTNLLSSRGRKAIEVLMSGGFFRKQLVRQYRGGEQFETRLRNADGTVAKGFGIKTFFELDDADMLARRECLAGSCWATEYELEGAS